MSETNQKNILLIERLVTVFLRLSNYKTNKMDFEENYEISACPTTEQYEE